MLAQMAGFAGFTAEESWHYHSVLGVKLLAEPDKISILGKPQGILTLEMQDNLKWEQKPAKSFKYVSLTG